MEKQKELNDLYRHPYFAEMQKKLEKKMNSISIPFLPSILRTDKSYKNYTEDLYNSGAIRVMIVGQEVNGLGFVSEDAKTWDDKKSFEDVVNFSKDFYSEHSITNDSQIALSCDSSFFKLGWNHFVKKIQSDIPDKKFVFVWNNLNNIGPAGEGSFHNDKETDEYKALRSFKKSISLKELSILQPDIVIFLTGQRDDEICDFYNVDENQFEILDKRFDKNELAWIKNFPIAKVVYRTKHPTNGLSNDVKDAIIADIEENFK